MKDRLASTVNLFHPNNKEMTYNNYDKISITMKYGSIHRIHPTNLIIVNDILDILLSVSIIR